MFLVNAVRGSHEIIDEHYTTPSATGIVMTFAHFDGYSPMLDGSIRAVLAESCENIEVHVKASASSASLADNIRIRQKDNDFAIGTGGLSYMGSAGARMFIEVVISLPRGCGDVQLNALKLPIVLHSANSSGNIVLTTQSASISVNNVDAHTLTARSQSGAITFEHSSELNVEKWIHVENTSGGIKLLQTSWVTPSSLISNKSGSISIRAASTATEVSVSSSSGSISADWDYMDSKSSRSTYKNQSGSINVKLQRWSGSLTVATKSGGKSVKGDVEKYNEGWRSGTGDSITSFEARSGSVSVTVM